MYAFLVLQIHDDIPCSGFPKVCIRVHSDAFRCQRKSRVLFAQGASSTTLFLFLLKLRDVYYPAFVRVKVLSCIICRAQLNKHVLHAFFFLTFLDKFNGSVPLKIQLQNAYALGRFHMTLTAPEKIVSFSALHSERTASMFHGFTF